MQRSVVWASKNLVIKDQQIFRNLAMIKSGADFNIYYWHHEGIFLIVILYVDDLIITSTSPSTQQQANILMKPLDKTKFEGLP